jgi:hypothetical protein
MEIEKLFNIVQARYKDTTIDQFSFFIGLLEGQKLILETLKKSVKDIKRFNENDI